MRSSSRTIPVLLAILSLLTPTLTRQAPTSYCKCICFQNSTIIPLNSPPSVPAPPPAPPSIPSSSPTASPPSDPQAPPQQPPQQSSLPTDDDDQQTEQSPSDSPSLSLADFHHNILGGLDFDVGSRTIARRDDGDDDDEDDDNEGGNRKHHRHLTCSDCNRAFCLDYNLPICKGASEEDVFTSCFQRDSVKDETVVLLFILLTASLLSWAVLKPYIDRFRDSDRVRAYAPVSFMGNHNSNDDDEDESGFRRNGGGGGGGNGRAAAASSGSLLPRTENTYMYRDDHRGRSSETGSVARQGGLNS